MNDGSRYMPAFRRHRRPVPASCVTLRARNNSIDKVFTLLLSTTATGAKMPKPLEFQKQRLADTVEGLSVYFKEFGHYNAPWSAYFLAGNTKVSSGKGVGFSLGKQMHGYKGRIEEEPGTPPGFPLSPLAVRVARSVETLLSTNSDLSHCTLECFRSSRNRPLDESSGLLARISQERSSRDPSCMRIFV